MTAHFFRFLRNALSDFDIHRTWNSDNLVIQD
jgi:hypothetical protein